VHHVFVSYSRADAEWVNGLVDRLKTAGVDVWIDQRDIPVTLPWFEEVRDAIVEAALFLVCDSERWQHSEHCASEAGIAFEAGKRACTVVVGSDLVRATAGVRADLGALEVAYLVRTDLRVRARDWDRAFRPRDGLVSARHRRRLELGAGVEPRLSVVERAFLRASRRRARGRTVATVAVFALVATALLAIVVSNAAQTRISAINDDEARFYMDSRVRAVRNGDDHYTGLADATGLGRNESAVNALAVTAALHLPVPDDGFHVPTAATRFREGPVDATVVVTDGRGGTWQRAATASKVRDAVAAAALREPRAERPDGLSARAVRDRGIVEVFRHGVLWRRIDLSRRVRTIEISPNGRELAAAVGSSVAVADLRLGSVRLDLRSTMNAVRDVAWSADGRRVWALSDKLAVSWVVHDGVGLVDEPNRAFNAVFSSDDVSRAWVAADDGELSQIDLHSGRRVRRIRIDDTIRSAAGAPDGAVAAVSGSHGVWIVSLTARGKPRFVSTPDCTLGRPAFMSARSLYVPCLSGPLLRISVAEGRVVERRNLRPGGIFAVRVMPRARQVLVTDVYGWVYVLTQRGLRELVKLTCGGYVSRLALSPDERVLVPAGVGVGQGTCALRGMRTGSNAALPGSWRFDHVLEPENETTIADSAAVSRGGGTFAYGFADGGVVIHPSENLVPSRAINGVVGRVRDMYVTSANDLIVATDAGIVQRIRLCETCLSNRALAHVAEARLRRGITIGTVRTKRRP